MNIDRKLATIQIIKDIAPIKGADRIEVATIMGWKVVVERGKFEIGDKIIYCEIDSLLPITEEYEFLRKTSYIKTESQEGFLLRSIRLRKQISQGLILPINNIPCLTIGCDVTEYLGIVKYEVPIPNELKDDVIGKVPSFIQKTNEERIQSLTDDYLVWKENGITFYATEKLDGQSTTFYLNNGIFGACGRNWEYKRNENNPIWKFAISNNIEEKLRAYGKNIAIQGELIGSGIEGNNYKLDYKTIRFFTVFNIDEYKIEDYDTFVYIIKNVLQYKTAPLLETDYNLPESVEELVFLADGPSALNTSSFREGIVFRSTDSSISFKVISNQYLINE